MLTLLLLIAVHAGIDSPQGPRPAYGDHAQVEPRHQEPPLYRTVLIRAAPGRLLELIEAYDGWLEAREANGAPPGHLLRHSQGDQWDLLLLQPVGAAGLEAAPSRSREFEPGWDELVAWREELWVRGPALAAVGERLEGAGLFHVEMFVAVPGKRNELLEQRRMENRYLRALGRPENLIFWRVGGAAWDLFTLGAYRDLRHFAESADIPAEREDRAARAAGFEAADRIGTYLRSLMAYHHDTLAGRAR